MLVCEHGVVPVINESWPVWARTSAQWLLDTQPMSPTSPERGTALTLEQAQSYCQDQQVTLSLEQDSESPDRDAVFQTLLDKLHFILEEPSMYCTSDLVYTTFDAWMLARALAPGRAPSLGLCTLALLASRQLTAATCLRALAAGMHAALPSRSPELSTLTVELCSRLTVGVGRARHPHAHAQTQTQHGRLARALRVCDRRRALLHMLREPPWRFTCANTSKYFPVTDHSLQLGQDWDELLWSAFYPRDSASVHEHVTWLCEMPVDAVVWQRPLRLAAIRALGLSPRCALASIRHALHNSGAAGRERPLRGGWVYFVASDYVDYVKIGQTSDPHTRFTAYRTYIVQPRMHAFRVDDHTLVEKQILAHFAGDIIQGEMVQAKADTTARLQDYITTTFVCHARAFLS
jgi:hypothetical protein